MLLDIIIPQYSETEEEIKYLLNSISLQKNVDFNLINITIVNDASNVILSNEFLMKYNNLDISYIFNKVNTGPGLARELGINSTQNPYIMFMDADDIFFNEYSLEGIIKFIKEHDFKYLVTNIAVEAIKDNKKITYIKRDKETFPWMHGKVFKRIFLKENNISFSTKIRHLEDSYFTTCVLGSLDASEITYFDFTTFVRLV